mmetsp:Transcript_5598/g.9378  ORF Transcript_5598/g.9378 Transcript_5598/m.9378 type:complete len:274 (+) Transcript_5598:18-839(+)
MLGFRQLMACDCISRLARTLLVFVLCFFAMWNLTKLPYYWPFGSVGPPMTNVTYDPEFCASEPPDRRCFGVETQANIAAWMPTYRAGKILADPSSFLAPHVAMAVVLEGMIVCVLCSWVKVELFSKVFLPLTIAFAVHILPVSPGIPDRLTNAPVNETLVVLMIAASLVAYMALKWSKPLLLRWMWLAIGLLLNTAPLGEWPFVAQAFATRRADGSFVSPDGDMPSALSGHDILARAKIPVIFWLITIGILVLVPWFLYRDVKKQAAGDLLLT